MAKGVRWCMFHSWKGPHFHPPYSSVALPHKSSMSKLDFRLNIEFFVTVVVSAAVGRRESVEGGANATAARVNCTSCISSKNLSNFLSGKKWPTRCHAFSVFRIFTQESKCSQVQVSISEVAICFENSLVLFSNLIAWTRLKWQIRYHLAENPDDPFQTESDCLNFMLVTGNSVVWLAINLLFVKMTWHNKVIFKPLRSEMDVGKKDVARK